VLEIEAEYSGILKEIIALPGTVVKITEIIAYIDEKDDGP
jgi:pyruvate/2-oxoglutarate dehydrogenase complex dihydrolipoamide acyltransferase (E2) component